MQKRFRRPSPHHLLLLCLAFATGFTGCSSDEEQPGLPDDVSDDTDAETSEDPETDTPVVELPRCAALWEGIDMQLAYPPSLAQLAPSPEGPYSSASSPRAIDVNGDGCRDFVFGVGNDAFIREPDENFGRAVAVDGTTHEVLWEVEAPGELVGSATPIETVDGGLLVVLGGRFGSMLAVDAATGERAWLVDTSEITEDETILNFYTALPVSDQNSDGVADLIAVYGGDALAGPGEERVPSHLVLVSGETGDVLHARETPDGAESYTSPVRWLDANGDEHFIFGTGGETLPGSLYAAELASFVDEGTTEWAVELVEGNDNKGFIAPATIVDANGDGTDDIVAVSFGGEVTLVSGSDFQVVWNDELSGVESFQTAGVVRGDGGSLALALTYNTGIFPIYTDVVHRLLDAATGEELERFNATENFAASPIAFDLTGDGVDEVLFFSSGGFSTPDGMTIRIHNLVADESELITMPWSSIATPMVYQAEDFERLELVAVTFSSRLDGEGIDQRYWAIRRLDLQATAEAVSGWTQYLGPCSDGRADCN